MSALVLSGLLAADARAMRTTDGTYVLQVKVSLPGGAKGKPVTVQATKQYGTGEAAGYACKNRAYHLKRGVPVTLRGATLAWLRGEALLGGLDHIEAPDLMARRNPTTGDD